MATIRALIRKYPVNAVAEENNEVWLYPWRNADQDGRPYTLEGYRYAMCENVPDTEPAEGEDDPRMDLNNYTVTEHTREIPSDTEEEGTITQKYWTAVYTAPAQNE